VFDARASIKQKFKAISNTGHWTDRTCDDFRKKASTRTRLSFEAGMQQLGAARRFISHADSQLGRGEPVEDARQVISRMSDLVMIRTFEQNHHLNVLRRIPACRYHGLTMNITLSDPGRYLHLYRTRGSIQGKTVLDR